MQALTVYIKPSTRASAGKLQTRLGKRDASYLPLLRSALTKLRARRRAASTAPERAGKLPYSRVRAEHPERKLRVIITQDLAFFDDMSGWDSCRWPDRTGSHDCGPCYSPNFLDRYEGEETLPTAVTDEIRSAVPLLPESSSSESVGVETVMNDLRDGIITIPDYQRDCDQWDEVSKSLFVESVINNLTIPALFFEAKFCADGVERSEVVDGQQRLTTLRSFYEGAFGLVSAGDAPYLSPNSIHYAGKQFEQLPTAYKQAFKKYRLTVINLRQLGDMRLEVFRRINQGGTPLSGQDIRLAYFGEDSPSVAFIRLAGVYDCARGQRFIDGAERKYGVKFPWNNELAFDTWSDWWEDKEISRGQSASEMFLWSLLAAQVQNVASLLLNQGALEKIRCRYVGTISDALDAYCAQVQYQDRHPELPSLLMSLTEMRDEFFPHFQEWIDFLLRCEGNSLPVTKHRLVGSVIGAAYRDRISARALTQHQALEVVAFIRSPRDIAKKFKTDWPESKGRWVGQRGYQVQFEAAYQIIKHWQ